MYYHCECVEAPTVGNSQVTFCSGAIGEGLYNAQCEESTLSTSELSIFTDNVDAGTIGYVYAWGVAAVLGLWVIGYAVGLIKRVVNLA